MVPGTTKPDAVRLDGFSRVKSFEMVRVIELKLKLNVEVNMVFERPIVLKLTAFVVAVGVIAFATRLCA